MTPIRLIKVMVNPIIKRIELERELNLVIPFWNINASQTIIDP